MNVLFAMAWRNLWRHGLRTGLTALAMGSVAAIVIWLLSLQGGIREILERVGVTESVGHALIQHPDFGKTQSLYDSIDDAAPLLATLDAIPGTVATAPRLHGNALLGGPDKTTGAVLRGIDPPREYALTGLDETVVRGEPLAAEADARILLGAELAKNLGVDVGSEVVAVTQDADGGLGNALYTVAGLLETGDPLRDRSGAVLHLADLQELLAVPGTVHDVVLTTSDIDAEVVTPWLTRVRSALGSRDLRARPWWEVEPQLAEILGLQTIIVLVMSSIFLGIAGLVVVNSLLMSVYERTRELGVLRAIGLKPRNLVVLVFFESLLLGGLAASIGLALGAVVVGLTSTWGLDLSVGDGRGFETGSVRFDPVIYGSSTPEVFVVPLTITFVCALIAGVIPALRVASIRPIDALRQG